MSTNDTDDIREKIVRIYRSLSPGGRLPREDERGELDSLTYLEFVLSIEREFGIIVDGRELTEANFATTAATTAFVRSKLTPARS